jgi:hypothetical protein
MLRMDVLGGTIQAAFQREAWSTYHSRSRWGVFLVATALAAKAAIASSVLKQYHPPATRSMKTAVEDHEVVWLLVVHPGKAVYPLTEKIQVLPLVDVSETWNYG